MRCDAIDFDNDLILSPIDFFFDERKEMLMIPR